MENVWETFDSSDPKMCLTGLTFEGRNIVNDNDEEEAGDVSGNIWITLNKFIFSRGKARVNI